MRLVRLAPEPCLGPVGRCFTVFFASIGLAAWAGGTVHGFFPDPAGPSQRGLWLVTLLAIGITA